jgi:hypothetical protein
LTLSGALHNALKGEVLALPNGSRGSQRWQRGCGNENARVVLVRYSAIVCLDQKEDKRWAVRWIFTPEMA